MDPVSYETHLVQTAFQYTRFFLLTYGSLQVAVLVFCKGWLRAVAALPLIVMVPIRDKLFNRAIDNCQTQPISQTADKTKEID